MNSFDFSLVEEQDPSVGERARTGRERGPSCVQARRRTGGGGGDARAGVTAEGHRVLYDREVPFEIRNQTDPHDSAQEVRRLPVASRTAGLARPACICAREHGRGRAAGAVCSGAGAPMTRGAGAWRGVLGGGSGGHAGGHQGKDLDHGRGAEPADAANRAHKRKRPFFPFQPQPGRARL